MQMARLLRLARTGTRTGDDAVDENGNRFELKSTTKGDVGTGRDVGEVYFARMERRYLVCAMGTNTQFGFTIQRLWFLAPSALEPWIRSRRDGLRKDRELVNRLLAAAPGTLTGDEEKRLRYLVDRGSTLNNPKISRSYIERHGTLLSDADVATQLRQLVAAHPIPQPASVDEAGEPPASDTRK
jgi:hypothetical protein